MKFYPVVFVAALVCVLISCRKERNCTCITTSTGVKTVHTQSPAVTFSLAVPLPVALPPFTLTPAVDQTTSKPYNIENTEVIVYDRIKYGVAKQVCTTSSSDKINTTDIDVSGTTTVTTTDVGSRDKECKLD